MEITTMNEETERVSADLLATSVSKAVLAKEVLRLKQLRDELAQSTSDSPVALAERCKQLCREIMHEEQRAAQETAELAEELARARDELLEQREASEHRESGMSYVSTLPVTRQTIEDGAVGVKQRARFDAAFIEKMQDIKRRLHDTSIEFATPLERSSGHVRGFLRSSNARIQVVVERIGTLSTQRDIHTEIKKLLSDNAALRVSVNDYAEGLLADTFDLLDEAPGNAARRTVPV